VRRLSSLLACVLQFGCEDFVPGRSNYDYVSTTCAGGINQQPELATPDQCADARNVWGVTGRVEQRPGYLGVVSVPDTSTDEVLYARAEYVSGSTFTNANGAGVLTLGTARGGNPLAARVTSGGDYDRWYLGRATPFDGVSLTVVAPNSAATTFEAEYWNGTSWKGLPITEVDSNEPYAASAHIASSGATWFLLARPQDWATTSVNSQSAYWLRFNLVDADVSAATQIDVDVSGTGVFGSTDIRGAIAAQFPTTKRYVFVVRSSNFDWNTYVTASSSRLQEFVNFNVAPRTQDEPVSFAVIPEAEELYATYSYVPTVHKAFPSSTDSIAATVETDPAIVGTGAIYDQADVPQLGTWPESKYILFYDGYLWAFNFKDSPSGVRWSAPYPDYKVWPTISTEAIIENDNSPITGAAGFNQNVFVFKSDSIWRMVYAGDGPNNLGEYTYENVSHGVGCVSNSAAVEVRSSLVFPAEDGLYAVTSEGAVVNVGLDQKTGANRIVDFWASITPGRRPYMTAVNWKSKGVYLLAVSVNGSDANNRVLVWDYNKDAFWIWDNIEAQFWMLDEDSSDNEKLLFGDSSGRIYEMGVGLTDHGAAVSSYVLTQRFGRRSSNAKRLREVVLHGSNSTRSATVEVIAEDEPTGTSATLDFTDETEMEYGTAASSTTATYNVDSYVPPRRRNKRVMFRRTADWFQVKVSHSTKNAPLELSKIELGMLPLGDR
jgi:hypothetical protein